MDTDKILKNINQYIEHMGLRKDRLSKMMGKSISSFYANLRGEHPKSIYAFSIELAQVLGEEENFFIVDHLNLPNCEIEEPLIAFSLENEITEEGRTGLTQIKKICELINIYN